MFKDKKIIVITGGFSNEREVALRSGQGVYKALIKQGYTNLELFDLETQDSIKELIDKHLEKNYDLAFLTTHGKFGEDGCLQGLLEIIKLPYTGTKVMQSAICMNKDHTKKILAANSLPVLDTYTNLDELVENEYILKPNTEGSSVGIEKFDNKADLINFVQKNKVNLNEYIIERFVQGTELTASIFNYDLNENNLALDLNIDILFMTQGNLVSLPLLELRPKNEFYDYEAKYKKGMTEFILPTELGENLQKKIHEISLEAYRKLELSGLARVDFIVDNSSKEPYILEINTLPGMTDTSDAPAQALSANISYEDLVEIMAQECLQASLRSPKG